MPRVVVEVEVAADEALVRDRLVEAADDPAMVVGWFTGAGGVKADVGQVNGDRWIVKVAGPAFTAEGSVVVFNHTRGTAIGVDVDVRPKGLLGTAGVLAAVATGQIDREIREALWKEFGKPDG